ncbi:MAG: hypothetical protein AAF288_03985 [Planctomycetota bacterium]
MLELTGRLIAALFACASFAGALIYGQARGGAASDVIGRALIVLVCCYLVGLVVGRVAQACVVDHVRNYEQANPIPQEPDLLSAEADVAVSAEPPLSQAA